MDSIQKDVPDVLPDEFIAPGADENGSGSIVLLEVLRLFLSHVESAGPLKNEVQFHWYGANEAGLLGSENVFSIMRSTSLPLRAMLNLDMVGYPGGGIDQIGVQRDGYVDKNLTSFVRTLVETVSNNLSLCHFYHFASTASGLLLQGRHWVLFLFWPSMIHQYIFMDG